jgi:hypothetical protein
VGRFRGGDGLPARQGLFIIGAARSGTTILTNALNHSPDIYLFGEPNFQDDPGTPDFAARYNAGHRFWGMQETKSTFCPPVLAGDGTWQDYMRALARQHRYVGAKTVINPVRPQGALDKLFGFHCRFFYRARYIFTFRDPVATVISTRDLQILLVGRTDGVPVTLRSYLDTIGLFVRMLRALPHVRAVCHEDITPAAFDALQHWLGVDLAGCAGYYQPGRVLPYSDASLSESDRALMAPVVALYAELRAALAQGFATPQLDQSNNHFSPTHLTALGRIAKQAAALAATLPLGVDNAPPQYGEPNVWPSRAG